jgi:hypothetical protein
MSACGARPKRHDQPSPPPPAVEVLRATFAARVQVDWEDGWPSKVDCDGTLWAGLACAAGVPVAIQLAEYEPGQVHRRPAPSCWDGGDRGARATTSQDMLTGYMLCAWRRRDLAALQRLADYGERHDWVMGAPASATERVVLRRNLRGLLGRMILVLSGGKDRRGYRALAPIYLPVVEDYERHIQVLGIQMQGEVDAETPLAELRDTGIEEHMYQRLKTMAEEAPADALFQGAYHEYSDGDMAAPTALLLDDATPTPTYVRGADTYKLVHWLHAASRVLRRTPQ